jgi:hypothetical protein
MQKKIVVLGDQLTLLDEDWLDPIEVFTPDDNEETDPFIVIPSHSDNQEGGDGAFRDR